MGLRCLVHNNGEITHHSSPTLDSSLSTEEQQMYELSLAVQGFTSLRFNEDFLFISYQRTQADKRWRI